VLPREPLELPGLTLPQLLPPWAHCMCGWRNASNLPLLLLRLLQQSILLVFTSTSIVGSDRKLIPGNITDFASLWFHPVRDDKRMIQRRPTLQPRPCWSTSIEPQSHIVTTWQYSTSVTWLSELHQKEEVTSYQIASQNTGDKHRNHKGIDNVRVD